jgi:photosystem II stability/assembly factor-like uncharacterized protein
MLRHFRVLLAFIVVAAMAGAGEASKWTTLKCDEAGDANLNGVCFLDANTGWVVGDKGLCLTTADGGKTWAKVDTKAAATLRCVRFKDANTGYISGDGDEAGPPFRGHFVTGRPNKPGTLLTTTDGGKTWKCAWVNTNFDICCVEISTAPVLQVGMSGGVHHPDGDIMRSQNNGANWSGSRCYRALFDIRSDGKQWVAVGSSVAVGFFPPPDHALYLEKNCRALYSRDGGNNWALSSGSEGKGYLRGAAMKSGAPTLAVGDEGGILVSEDGGANWKAATSNTKSGLSAVAWSPAQPVAVAIGRAGAVVVSADAAKTWTASSVGKVTLNAICPAGETFVIVGEKANIFRAEVKDLGKPQ